MLNPIMIGARGWSDVIPGDDFYPEELPSEWRFSFYSNNLRSVLVPRELWPATSRTDVSGWLDDCDPAFRFVLELPAALSCPLSRTQSFKELDSFLELCEPIAPRVAGYLLRVDSDARVESDWLETFANALVDIAPLCVDLPEGPWRSGLVLAALTRQGAGLCWHCATQPEPHPGGRLRLALAPPAAPRITRRYIERLVHWQNQEAQAGLFFTNISGAAKAAYEARLIAELMGV